MLLRIKDIPAEGKQADFDLDNQTLNSRISSNLSQQPDYAFNGITAVKMKVSLQASTVILEGKVSGDFTTSCSRCGNPASQHIEVPINMVLKPTKADADEDEDLNFGYYDGEFVNCAEIAEELLVLALPMVVKCETEECKNQKESWVFGEEIESSNPFKNIKLVH